MKPEKTVLLFDWRGRLNWCSAPGLLKQGEFAWDLFAEQDVEKAKTAIARATILQEEQVVEIQGADGAYLRLWLWALDPPEAAVCMMCMRIPELISELTARERDCMVLLAQGLSTKLIAQEMNIGLSTVHTHMKRIRTKLNLPRVEALISFAARFFYPQSSPLANGQPSE